MWVGHRSVGSLVRVWSARGPRTDEKRRKPLRTDERRKPKQGKGCRRLALMRLGCPKPPDKPSHGRGHWFDPSSAHSEKLLIRGKTVLALRGSEACRQQRVPPLVAIALAARRILDFRALSRGCVLYLTRNPWVSQSPVALGEADAVITYREAPSTAPPYTTSVDATSAARLPPRIHRRGNRISLDVSPSDGPYGQATEGLASEYGRWAAYGARPNLPSQGRGYWLYAVAPLMTGPYACHKFGSKHDHTWWPES